MLDSVAPEAYLPRQVDGEQVRILRKANGLSQRELAQMLDVPQATVSKWETGVYRMTMRDALAVVHVLNAWKDRKTRKVS